MALETDQATAPGAVRAALSAPDRLGYVDSLRALAALVVVICHMFLTVWFALSSPLIAWLVVHLIIAGRIAVSVFIVLSGFSLMLPVARNANRLPHGALRFYGRRAAHPAAVLSGDGAVAAIDLALNRYEDRTDLGYKHSRHP